MENLPRGNLEEWGLNVPKQRTWFLRFFLVTGFLPWWFMALSPGTGAGAWPVTMAIPSSGQEITAALVLAQTVPTAAASSPVAAIRTP